MAPSSKILRHQADLVLSIVHDAEQAVQSGVPADATLARLYRQHREYGSRDRRLFSDMVFAYFRWKGWLVPPLARNLAGACVLAHLLDVDVAHPAIMLLKETMSPVAAPLEPMGGLNLLDKAHRVAQCSGMAESSPEALVPDWFADVFRAPPDVPSRTALLSTIAAFQTSPPTWVRVRPGCRSRVLTILGELSSAPLRSERIPDALALPRGANLRALSPQLRGQIEIQDLASQITGLICAPRPGESWWDVCCGAGGKALHLADLMAGRGHLLATDVRTSILEEALRRVEEARLRCVQTRLWNGLTDPVPDIVCDGVLVDAPCSGMGTWHRNPDARWRTTRRDVERLAVTQRTLLDKGARAVRPGGVLVYATCTLSRQENESIVARFLETSPEFTPAVFVHPLDGTTCTGQAWIYPWQGSCNGMFVARFVRGR